jgi:hypothetical protein
MTKRLNSWIIANLGWLTVTGIIAVVVLINIIFIPDHAEKVLHAKMTVTHEYHIKQLILRLLLTFLTLTLSVKTAIYTYKNYEDVILLRLFKFKVIGFSASPVGYTLNRFLMASAFYIFISSTILAFT